MKGGGLREFKAIKRAHIALRCAYKRIQRSEGVLALARSIERFGQILPRIILREGIDCPVLIDGTLRD
jgi:hypothetical protein